MFLQDLGHESKQLALLGIRVSTNPLEVSGKLLVPPPIKYNGGLLASVRSIFILGNCKTLII